MTPEALELLRALWDERQATLAEAWAILAEAERSGRSHMTRRDYRRVRRLMAHCTAVTALAVDIAESL